MDESTRASLPEPDSVSPVPESVTSAGGASDAPDVSHVPAEHRPAVRRLHRRVEQAAEAIQQLRAENERLRRRVEELEAQPSFSEDETVLTVEDDPEEVRDQITRFIDTIDAYLDAAAPDPESEEDGETANDMSDS